MIIRDAMDAYGKALEKAWPHDRMQTIGASEIGQCERRMFWFKNELDTGYAGVERDPDFVDSWGARTRGTMFEKHFWEPAMRARFGRRLLFAGEDQKTFFNDFLSATPDGLIVDLTAEERKLIGTDANCVLAECKTADPRTNLNDPKAENAYQAIVQIGLVRETTAFKPTHTILSYTDASWWSDVKEFVIPFEADVYEIANERAARIMTATSALDMHPEGWIGGGKECGYCPFTRACGIERRNLPYADKPVDPQFLAEITDLARELKDAEAGVEMSEVRVRELQDEIRNRLRAKGVRKIPGVVSWSSVKGRSGYDNKAIQAAAIDAGIDIEKFATTGQSGDRLTVQLSSSR